MSVNGLSVRRLIDVVSSNIHESYLSSNRVGGDRSGNACQDEAIRLAIRRMGGQIWAARAAG